MSLLPLDWVETMRIVNVPGGNVLIVRLFTSRPVRALIRLPFWRTSTFTIRCPFAWCSLNVNRRVSSHGGVVGVTVGAAAAPANGAAGLGSVVTQFFVAVPLVEPT